MPSELPFYEQWDFWVSIGTLLLAGVTGWLAVETRRIRRGSDEAMADMRRYAAVSADAATASAKAAEQSTAAAKALLEVGNRPWLTASQIQVLARTVTGLPETLVTTLENGGRSPVLALQFAQWSAIGESLEISPEYRGFHPVPKGSVGPGLQGQIPSTIAYTEEDQNALFAQRKKLYIYGLARYIDVFGGRHETKWALEYNLRTQQFAACSFHNEMT